MRRNAFVWQVQTRREILDDELLKLRDLPYSVWRETLSRSLLKPAKARDRRAYWIRVKAAWARAGSQDLRVDVTLETRALHRRLMRESFVITPDNRFAN